jgi:multidrug resistance efflux pump
MPDEVTVSLHADAAEAPATNRKARKDTDRDLSPGPKAEVSRRRWVRPALFLLLPLALIVGAYAYVTGGQVMSTDDAYVEADKVGVSTDVSGIVKQVAVTENQHVAAEQSFDAAHRSQQNAQQKLASLTQQRAVVGANLNGGPSAV